MKIQTDNKDRYQEGIKRNEEGILRRPMANTYKFQMISATNIIILSMLFGTVIAKSLENLERNELVKEVSEWVPTSLEDKNY